ASAPVDPPSHHLHGELAGSHGLDEEVGDRDEELPLLEAQAGIGTSTRDHRDVLHLDQLGKPAIDRLTDLDGHGRSEGVGLAGEDELAQTAAELGEADPLAGTGEQQLANHLVDVNGIGGLGALTRSRVDAEREAVVLPGGHRQSPATRVWAAAVTRTVPCSPPLAPMHVPTLSLVSAAAPP